MPDAERLCRSRFTSTGKTPTQASITPMTTNSVDTVAGED